MGFFDKMKSMAEKANDFLNGEDDDKLDEVEVIRTPPPTLGGTFKMGVLGTQPAPGTRQQ